MPKTPYASSGLARVADIRPSATNPRDPQPSDAAIQSLAADMRLHGVLQPLLVRQVGTKMEVVDGHRRLVAAKLAKLAEVPCLTIELTDSQAAEYRLAAALQHQDLAPLEEAEAFRQLAVEHGLDADVIAARVGRSRGYVLQRLKLLGLADELKAALADGHMPLGVALVLLRLADHDDQRKAWQRMAGENATVAEAERVLEAEFMRELSEAPWKLTTFAPAQERGKLPTCAGCEQRTDTQRDLFGDTAPSDARCLNGECWRAKLAAHTAALTVRAEKAGKRVVRDGKDWVMPDEMVQLAGTYQSLEAILPQVKVESAVVIRGGKLVGVVSRKAVEAEAVKAGLLHAATESAEDREQSAKAQQAAIAAHEGTLRELVEAALPVVSVESCLSGPLLLNVAVLLAGNTGHAERVLRLLGQPMPEDDGDNDTVGDALKAYAEQSNQNAVAAIVAMSVAPSINWNGEFGVDELARLAKLLGVKLPATVDDSASESTSPAEA